MLCEDMYGNDMLRVDSADDISNAQTGFDGEELRHFEPVRVRVTVEVIEP